MHDPAPNRPPSAVGGRECPDLAAAFAGLLAAHDDGSARGVPLLTDAGVAHVRRLVLAARAGREGLAHPPSLPALPHWDAGDRRLWLGGRVVKSFRQPAPRQALLLAAFEERGWPAGHVDDPLPPEVGDGAGDRQRRLHDTVRNLNRGLPAGTIRFHGDGTGAGVSWGYAPPAAGVRNRPR